MLNWIAFALGMVAGTSAICLVAALYLGASHARRDASEEWS